MPVSDPPPPPAFEASAAATAFAPACAAVPNVAVSPVVVLMSLMALIKSPTVLLYEVPWPTVMGVVSGVSTPPTPVER